MTDHDPFCQPPDETLPVGAGCETGPIEVVVSDIEIDEIDVSASGLTAVERCNAACEPVTLIVCKDENHADGHGDDTDTGVFEVAVVGHVLADGSYVAGAYSGVLTACTDCTADDIEVDVEWVCNETSGVFDQIVITSTNGTVTDQTTTPTAIACSVDLDYEQPVVCRAGTRWVLLNQVAEDGTVTELDAYDTGEPCTREPGKLVERCVVAIGNSTGGPYADGDLGQLITCVEISASGVATATTEFLWINGQVVQIPDYELEDFRDCPPQPSDPECVKWRSTVIALDNTGTRYNESHELTITHADGSTAVINAAPQAGWTQQVNHWVDLLSAEYPDAIVEARCNLPAGCGGLLPPPADAVPSKLIKWRYVSLIFCPTDERVPVKIEITASSNPVRVGRVLDLELFQTPERRGRICYTCGGPDGELQWPDGTPVPEADLPACWFECAESIPVPPPAVCDSTSTDGCDDVNSVDPADWVNIIRTVTVCEGVDPQVTYSIVDPADPTALIDYTLVGQFVDCASGEPVPEPPLPCDADTVLCDVVEECADPCAVYHVVSPGRPNNGVSWSWGPFYGDTYAEFSDAMAAGGLTELIADLADIPNPGEAHIVCGAAAPTDTELFVDGVSQGVPATHPNPEAEPETSLRVHLDGCTIAALTTPVGMCGAVPAPSGTLTATPGGAANGGVCDADLVAWLKPTAGVKQQIKYLSEVKSVRSKTLSRTAETTKTATFEAAKTETATLEKSTALKREAP